jgi:hypothetical protein
VPFGRSIPFVFVEREPPLLFRDLPEWNRLPMIFQHLDRHEGSRVDSQVARRVYFASKVSGVH